MQIEHKGYTITQNKNGHIWISKGDNRTHINCDDILTEEELVAKADEFIQIEEIFDSLFEEQYYVPISQHNQEKNKKRRADRLSVCRTIQKYR